MLPFYAILGLVNKFLITVVGGPQALLLQLRHPLPQLACRGAAILDCDGASEAPKGECEHEGYS